jgi:Cu(I)/Ag(I) efflux system membrane fusion protein
MLPNDKDLMERLKDFGREQLAALKKAWPVLAAILLVVVIFLAGSWHGSRKAAAPAAAGGRKILHYVDPMNPAHTSPEPGLAPCGMKMEPVYADEAGEDAGKSMPPGTVKITPQKQQLIGVQLAPVTKAPYTYKLRALGKVAVDETRIYRLNAAVDGWIRETCNNSTGTVVKKDETLATFYSPEFLSAQQSLVYSLGAQDRYNAAAAQEPPTQRYFTRRNLKQAEDTLLNLGMSELQIKQIENTRFFVENISIVAPATSFILSRNISPGQRFDKGYE